MVKGFVVHPTYKVENGEAFVYLFGRLENGESFATKNKFRPYFFVRRKDKEKVLKIEKVTIEDTDLKNFNGDAVSKIVLSTPKEVPALRDKLKEENIEFYEADVRFAYRFLMDNDILGSLNIEGEYSKGERFDRFYEEPRISSSDTKIKLRVVSIDIETDKNAEEIYSIALYSDDYKRVLIQRENKLKNAEGFKDEKSMLVAFRDKIIELDPDIIVGWNLINFDMDRLSSRFKHYKIDFLIGRTEWPCIIRKSHDFFRESTASVPGRVVLDGVSLLKANFVYLEDYKLGTAAKELLGKKKLISENNKGQQIEDYFKKDPQKLVDYNLEDAKLVFEILNKKNILDLTITRSMLTGMPLDRVKASIASLDSLYLREARKRGLVCPTSKQNNREERIKGGFVMEPKPGIYDFVNVFDFKSLYSSIIRTFNIDPWTHNKKGTIKAPNGARFLAEDGILPILIQKLWKARDEAKKRKDDIASFAIKTTMNSFWGALANPVCRFYSLEMANGITSFARHIIQLTARLLEEKNYNVIYGDTDSVFVATKASNLEEAEKIGREIQEYINDYYENYVKEKYNRKNYLELEFEKTFVRFLMPKQRHQDVGAKKRYAGLLIKDGEERIDFTGLEFVRRDWTELAKKFQMELLDLVFHKKEIKDYIRNFVDDLKKGKHDELLVYKKAIRKPLEAYTKTTPPHVKAARKLKELKSNLIAYYMTVNGPEHVEARTSKIDYDHYIDRQLRPIADSILTFFGLKFDDVISGKQKKLFDY
ncbi:DNA polymerase II [Candidatus Woesearchaeota archaeon]|nr:MAG: DNA polymerase II [Candidatus Woesearchaeota archaeon]